MNSRKPIQNELAELNSALPSDLHKPVFGLPEGYFENFAASVLAKLEEESLSAADELSRLSPLLASVSKKTPFIVPETYFASLADNVPAFVSEESVSPLLANISKEMPFAVSAGYFNALPDTILNKVAPKKAKVIPMRTRWMRMAAAAIIAGIITIGGFMYVNLQTVVADDQSVAVQLQGVSDKELEDFVNTAEVGGDQVAQSAGTSEISGLLSDVSTTEMDAFLEQLPTDDEELLIIN